MSRRRLLPGAELCTAYAAGQSTLALARRYGCSPTTVAKQLRAGGVALRRSRFAPAPIDEALLRQAYLDEARPVAAIAAMFGVSPATISNRRRQYGIPSRRTPARPRR
jgi:transposase-like protein